MIDHPQIGPTGQFPEGKINESDEGELVIRIAYDQESDTIIINFGVRVDWIGTTRKGAMALAETIVKKVLQAEEHIASGVSEKPHGRGK